MSTYHHVQWEGALWAEVLKLAKDRKHFVLPDFNKYHFMNQCGNLHKTHFLYIIHQNFHIYIKHYPLTVNSTEIQNHSTCITFPSDTKMSLINSS